MADETFEQIQELPCKNLTNLAESLVGFQARYEIVKKYLLLTLSPEELYFWSKKFHGEVLPICKIILQKYPLFVFSGDVGTGKTVTAQCLANRLTRELEKEGFMFKLSTRVRGKGLHGEMSQLIQNAFQELIKQAGKNRLAFLLIDEADAVASLRSTEQMHQEEKAAVNTLIQKIDDIRQVNGRAVVFLCTNRANVIDQAIIRRSALHMKFERPNREECLELFERDLDGIELTSDQLHELASLIAADGHHGGIGYTFSDFRLRFLPEAIVRAFPNRALTFNILKETALAIEPSPEISS